MNGAEPRSPGGFGIYVHWPFCLSKCPYCDFNSHATSQGAGTIPQAKWRDAYLRELAHFHKETSGLMAETIYFGGGTPSLMDPETVAGVVEAVRRLWGLAGDAEITLEANPTSVEAGKLRAFREAGATRVSLGVQALDDGALAFLGRRHSAAEALAAVATAAKTFPRFSFDLIYGRPGQTVAAWRGELARALGYAGGHLSLYQLTVEPGTAFFRDGVEGADEDTGAALFEATQDVMARAGLPAYEISNHARPGEESRHNLIYWRGGFYAGIGPGAHGRIPENGKTAAHHQIRDPARWCEAALRDGHGTGKRRVLSPDERAEELLLSGLRLREGIARDRFRALAGKDVTAFLDASALARLIEGGFLVLDARALRATREGRQRLNAVLAQLVR